MDLSQLKEEHEKLSLEAQNAALAHEIALLTTAGRSALALEVACMQGAGGLLEVGQIIGSNTGYLDDHPGFGRPDATLDGNFHHRSMVDDRLQGRNRPFYENEDQLAEIRGTCRVLVGLDEAAIGILGNLTNYIVGTGFKYSLAAKDDEDATSIAAAELSQAVVDEFRQRVKWRRKEREFHDRTRRDGEALLQINAIGGGYSACRFREPDSLTQPHDSRAADEFTKQFSLDWSFGVATDWGNQENIHAYFFDNTGDQSDVDIVLARDMVHSKKNTDCCLKRGLSDFYPVWQELTRAAKILRNTGEGAALQAAIAWVKEHVPGVTSSQVQRLISGSSEARRSHVTPSGNLKTTEYTRYPAGTILNVPSGTQYKPGPMGSQRNSNFMLVSDSIIRYAGLRWNMPAFMTTGGNDSKTFAGNLVSESPFVKSIEAEQIWFVEEFEIIFWKILENAVGTEAFRRLGIDSMQKLRSLVSLNVKPPRVSTRNRKEETDINTVLYDKRLISGRTWASMEELDYDHEQELIKDEPEPVVVGGGQSGSGQIQRKDMQQGEQQNPVKAVGTGDNKESIRESLWIGYP